MLATTADLRCGRPSAVASAQGEPPDLVDGRYRTEELLGEGGMGIVVAAHDLRLDRRVALKCLRLELRHCREASARFWWEARLTSQLCGESFVRVTDAGSLPNGVPYFVMELLEGEDLGELMKQRGGRLDPEQAVEYVLQACEALAPLHARGIVHRDLKPKNLFVARRSGRPPILKIIDFGLAAGPGGPVSAASGAIADAPAIGECMGSPPYMSPEQVRAFDAVDARADVWSLGAVLYELLTGQLVHQAKSVETLLSRICYAPVPSIRTHRPEIAPELDGIVLGCLERDPQRRIQSAADLACRLRQFVAGGAVAYDTAA